MINDPYQQLNVSKDLACEFLGVFARCEYALKAGGFARGDEKEAKPDWDSFGRAISNKFNRSQNEVLQKAVDYLLAQPPKKQVLESGRLIWKHSLPNTDLSDIERALLMVRRVRNNLFHGGKFLSIDDSNPSRDRILVKHCLTILRAIIPLNESVLKNYEE